MAVLETEIYKKFIGIACANSVWVLHNDWVMKGVIVTRNITVKEILNDDGNIDVSRNLSMNIKLSNTILTVTTQPIALTKEDLINLITLDL